MGDIVVFPEQFSFDVRVQRSNPRRRLTIKNMGIMACKVTITMPETDSFIVTDAKGKTLGSKITINMIPDSSCCFFVQKKANVGIVPEDKMMVTGGKKPYCVVLKPAVSLVSIEELENAADASVASDNQSVKSNESVRRYPGKGKQNVDEFPPDERLSSQDESEPKHRPSRIKPPTKRISKAQSDDINTKNNDASFDPMKKMRKGIETKKPNNNNDIEFSAADFQIPQLAEDDEDDSSASRQPAVKRTKGKPSNAPSAIPAPKTTPKRPNEKDKKVAPSSSGNKIPKVDDDDDIPMPTKLDQSPPQPRKSSQIPVPHRHPDLPPDADVLEQSLHVKFSFKDDDFSKSPQKGPSVVKWYDDDAFKNVEEPYFNFELMMTGEGEDPVFCIDQEYYDSSGRLLSVNQGKGKVIFVTEDGYEAHDLGDDNENYNYNNDDDDDDDM